jgi:HK97 family phage major capsid protein
MIGCRAPAQAVEILRAPVGAVTTQSPGYASAVGAFINTLVPTSLYYRLYQDQAFVKVPLRTRVLFVPTLPAGTVVAEGAAKPLAAVLLATVMLEPVKAVSPVQVLSNEMLDDVGPAGQQFMARRLQQAVAHTADVAFLGMITSTGTSTLTSSGTSAANAWKDLRALQLLVCTTGAGSYYYACSPDVASKASSLADSAGAAAFPGMSAGGGKMANLPCVVSAGLAPGTLALLDGSGIVANSDSIETRSATQADLLMSDAPSMSSAIPTPTTMTSLWQTNSTAYLAEVSLAAQVMRDDAVALLENIDWGGA